MSTERKFSHLIRTHSVELSSGERRQIKYYDFNTLIGNGSSEDKTRCDVLPYSIRVILESNVRNCDGKKVKVKDVERTVDWVESSAKCLEICFLPSRVLLQDFTGVPALVDLAAMRDVLAEKGCDAGLVNPGCPVDLVIDHSVQVDFDGKKASARTKNEAIELDRNRERFEFLKWGSKAFDNVRIIPPGSGIVHQINLEYLACVAFISDCDGTTSTCLVYPDSVVGTDSHTTMINGLGVLGWGVGGIEAEAVMLRHPISMVLPEVVGYRVYGDIHSLVTSTDIVLTITKHLRALNVVGKIVEFFGPSVNQLSIADRSTISNMSPEFGATAALFPVDGRTIEYLHSTGRNKDHVEIVEAYLKQVGLFREDDSPVPSFTTVVELDLSSVVSSVSGPKRPQDCISVLELANEFNKSLTRRPGFNGFGVDNTTLSNTVDLDGHTIGHGSVLIAAITSCTNTSNPTVMLGAGLLASRAVERGLKVPPYVKTSLSPGSAVAALYLQKAGYLSALEQLGFSIVGYGCMTCIGNSGPLNSKLSARLKEYADKCAKPNDSLVCCGILSGNRNFEGRIHPELRANFLASPMLVIIYALAGRCNIDLDKEPIGTSDQSEPVFMRDIWPSRSEIQVVESQVVLPSLFNSVYSTIGKGNAAWQEMQAPESQLYPWADKSTYIRRPSFVDVAKKSDLNHNVVNARCLLVLGDSVTTDHISPAGNISRQSSAAAYLIQKGIEVGNFNSYGSRRGNDVVMTRGTFANIRLINKILTASPSAAGVPQTVYFPSGSTMNVYDAAMKYSESSTPLIVIAGKDYGSGSSRDWAAKGTHLLGIRAVVAHSFERIHRSNLIGMSVLPLQFPTAVSADTLKLDGSELFSFDLGHIASPIPKPWTTKLTIVSQIGGNEQSKSIDVTVRIDTDLEWEYLSDGGILRYITNRFIEASV